MPDVFYPKPKLGKVMVGIENELHIKDEDVRTKMDKIVSSKKYKGLIQWHEDGSLDDDDMEFISKPMTFTKSNLKKVSSFFNKQSKLAYCPSRSDTSYGLHVNVSGFIDGVFSMAQRFLCQNQKNVEKLAGRRANEYCEYDELDGEKYCCLHIRGDGIGEFRIFRATTRPERLAYRIQFCIALCQMFKDGKYVSGNWKDFEAYVKKCKTKYPELAVFLDNNLEWPEPPKEVARDVPAPKEVAKA